MAVAGAYLMRRNRYDCSEDIKEHYAKQKLIIKQTLFFQENLKCYLEINGNLIPEKSGIVKGRLVIQAKQDVKHTGIVILLKGNDVLKKYKFAVLGKKENGPVTISEGAAESYQLERHINVEQLPQPFITDDGQLVYKLEVYCYSLAETKILLGRKQVRWQGKTNVV